MSNSLKDKVILVTGGAGSIGSALVMEILKYEPKAIRVLDIHEFSLHQMQNRLSEKDRKIVRFLVGDVRDSNRLERAMNGVDIVYHAAAYKHVHLCDYNPLEAVKTNITGTQNAIDAAINSGVSKFVFISTDKAASPIGTLGASKLLGEKITTAANNYKGNAPTTFASVRFGNVTMSNGSVLPLFIKQMKNGQPITVTSNKMTRFLMPMQKAIELIFKATELMHGGEVFVLKMKSVNMYDLALALASEFQFINGLKSKPKIQKIGRRIGEKTHEQLIVAEESELVLDLKEMLVILPSFDPNHWDINNPFISEAKKVNHLNYSSDYKTMNVDEIREFLREHNIIDSHN